MSALRARRRAKAALELVERTLQTEPGQRGRRLAQGRQHPLDVAWELLGPVLTCLEAAREVVRRLNDRLRSLEPRELLHLGVQLPLPLDVVEYARRVAVLELEHRQEGVECTEERGVRGDGLLGGALLDRRHHSAPRRSERERVGTRLRDQ